MEVQQLLIISRLRSNVQKPFIILRSNIKGRSTALRMFTSASPRLYKYHQLFYFFAFCLWNHQRNDGIIKNFTSRLYSSTLFVYGRGYLFFFDRITGFIILNNAVYHRHDELAYVIKWLSMANVSRSLYFQNLIEFIISFHKYA
jgi:hypothetical protein